MRLIDADALIRHKRKMSGADFGGEFWDEAVLVSDIKAAPTIEPLRWIPASEPPTNADHIREMTDEKLAKALAAMCKNTVICDYCPLDPISHGSDEWLDWLQQPYKEERHE